MAGLIPFHRGGFGEINLWNDDFRNHYFTSSQMDLFKVDVKDKGDHYEIDAELPGLHREMIDLTLRGGYLIITANIDEEHKTKKDDYVIHERRIGKMSRSFPVGEVDADEVDAAYREGILKISVPKKNGGEEKTNKVIIE